MFTTAKITIGKIFCPGLTTLRELTNAIMNGATSAQKERGEDFSDIPLNRVSTTPWRKRAEWDLDPLPWRTLARRAYDTTR